MPYEPADLEYGLTQRLSSSQRQSHHDNDDGEGISIEHTLECSFIFDHRLLLLSLLLCSFTCFPWLKATSFWHKQVPLEPTWFCGQTLNVLCKEDSWGRSQASVPWYLTWASSPSELSSTLPKVPASLLLANFLTWGAG